MAKPIDEHEHFSKAAQLAVAVAVDMVAIFLAVLTLGSSFFLSGLAVGVGAVITGILVRRPVGRKAMWICFILAAVAIVLGVVAQMSIIGFR